MASLIMDYLNTGGSGAIGKEEWDTILAPPGGAHENIDMEILRNTILERFNQWAPTPHSPYDRNRVPLLDLLAQQRLGGAQSLGMPNLGMEHTPSPMSQFLGPESKPPMGRMGRRVERPNLGMEYVPSPPNPFVGPEGASLMSGMALPQERALAPEETLNLLERLLKSLKKKK